MITNNFQIKAKSCKYHQLPEAFVCLNSACQYRALLCPDCIREYHSDHLKDVKSLTRFMEYFRTQVSKQQQLFERDKIIVNVKQIIRSKINELEKTLNEIMVKVIKMLDHQKGILVDKLRVVQAQYEALETDYKANLEIRYDTLEYLSALKNSPEILNVKLTCASEWGVVSLKNALTDLKTLSHNRTRNINAITDGILMECDRATKEDCFLYGLQRFIHDFGEPIILEQSQCGARRVSSFVEKNSFITNNTISQAQQQANANAPYTSRSRTNSLVGIPGIRHVSSNQSLESRNQSLESLNHQRMVSETNIGTDRYLRGVKNGNGSRHNISRVIIK